MKAVVLAGGFGTRLRPLTNSLAKPLVPLLGKPLINYILDSLPDCVDQVLMAVNYRRDDLQTYFDTHDVGREVLLIDEEVPLGTGGALRNLKDHIDDRFFMFNGDVLCSLDLMQFYRHHEERGGMASIALWEVEDPQAFGVVRLEDDGRITEFQEKPAPGEEVSNLINAGVYIFEKEIIDLIPEGHVSLEREVFPKVLTRGMNGMRFSGHWVDCGTRESYLRAQDTLLRARVVPGGTYPGNVYIGDAEVGQGTVISNSAVLSGAKVGSGCEIRGSIIGPNADIKKDTQIYDAIVDSLYTI